MRVKHERGVVWTGKDRQGLYKEEDMILPKRFLPQLKGDKLTVIGRYSGKRHTKCGTKMYHDVQFMKSNDTMLQNVSLMQ